MRGILQRVLMVTALGMMAGSMASVARAQKTDAPIKLSVDSTQAPQKILHTHMEIPVQAGPLTLYYPEWIPGEHMPDGPIIQVAGMKFAGGGKAIPWRRDLVEMFSIHLDVPAGVTTLDADFDFLLAAASTGFSAGAIGDGFAECVELESSAAVSEGPAGEGHPVRAEPATARGMEIWHGAAGGETGWRHD